MFVLKISVLLIEMMNNHNNNVCIFVFLFNLSVCVSDSEDILTKIKSLTDTECINICEKVHNKFIDYYYDSDNKSMSDMIRIIIINMLKLSVTNDKPVNLIQLVSDDQFNVKLSTFVDNIINNHKFTEPTKELMITFNAMCSNVLLTKDHVTKIIDNHHTTLKFDVVIDVCDHLFGWFNKYNEIKEEIMSNVDRIVVFRMLEQNLQSSSHLEPHKFYSNDTILTETVSTFNNQYMDTITINLDRLNRFFEFVQLYDDVCYPQIFFTNDAINSLNELFNSVLIEKMQYDKFKQLLNNVFEQKTTPFHRLIQNAFEYSEKRGINVVFNLYQRCRLSPNKLKLRHDFIIDNCVSNPSSQYFLQEDSDTVRDIKFLVEENSSTFYNPDRLKKFSCYVANFQNFLFKNCQMLKNEFLICTKKYYYENVSHPINEGILNDYVDSFHNFMWKPK